MGRTHVTPVLQPDERTCGPASLKTALAIFGIKKSLSDLIKLCKTNKNGTTTKNLINAANKLGFNVLAVEYATLKHLQSALKYTPNKPRAVLVSYLSALDENEEPHEESGHWSVVSSYSASSGRIILLDSYTGKRISYNWKDFRNRWFEYDLKRRNVYKRGRAFQFVRHWQPQLMLVLALDVRHLPKFEITSSKLFEA